MQPFISQTDTVIPFQDFAKGDLQILADNTITYGRNQLAKIVENKEPATVTNTLYALDETLSELAGVSSIMSLLAYTHPDSAMQEEAQKSAAAMSQFFNELFLNSDLYKRIKVLAGNTPIEQRKEHEHKAIEDLIKQFVKNGLDLPETEQKEVRKLMNELSQLGITFTANIAAHEDALELQAPDMKGLPEDYKAQHRTEDGSFKIPLSYPSYFPFMKYAESDEAKKALQFKFKNIAVEKNARLLNDILQKRQELAHKLGFKSFAAYQLTDRMAQTAQKVWAFESQLQNAVTPKAHADYERLIQIKKSCNLPNEQVIESWQAAYLTTLLKKEQFAIDQEALRNYFPLEEVKKGLFQIASRLYGITFAPAENQPVWQKDVETWEIRENNAVIARFYLDLHPRKGKYNHAACFTLIPGRETLNGYQKPSAALVCNFPSPTNEKPALLLHNDVVTLFHEFGHLMHDLLTQAPLAMQSGTNVARDFVEMPSQIFENWAWDYESVSLFAKHYKTGDVLPEEMFQKVLDARNVDSGLHTVQQIFYGTLDMTLHDKFQAEKDETVTEVVKRLQEEITLYPFQEGTHFETGFGHLVGYAAGYYGYLWAKVYAEDMFHELTKIGLMNPAAGKKLRHQVLARGSSTDELKIVEQFLGREPSPKAFMTSIGL